MYLESPDPDYVDRILEVTYIPKKLVPLANGVPEHYVKKIKSEMTPEEKTEYLKDSKVKIILHNSLDSLLSNRVIACKTTKEIRDTLKTQCQGTEAIKKNRRALLIQEYEQFEAKSDEILTDVYDRFLTLLNNMSPFGKVYDREDSNTKFLRSLPEDWDTQTSIIKHQYELDTVSLDEVYGMLRTHDLEVQQRKNKKNSESRSTALKAEFKTNKPSEGNMSNKNITKQGSDTDGFSNIDENTNKEANTDEENDEIDEMFVMLVKGFKRMKFRRGQRQGRFQRKSSYERKDIFKKKEDISEGKKGKKRFIIDQMLQMSKDRALRK